MTAMLTALELWVLVFFAIYVLLRSWRLGRMLTGAGDYSGESLTAISCIS